MAESYPLLSNIKNYKGLSTLGEADMPALCRELRSLIMDVTLRNGGHLGGSLGAVELCVALLCEFDPERDKIIFDVGHQAYAYKILTDRLESFRTLRTKGGISGFPRRSESRYDAFDVGHSSTSISAALGMAKARDLTGEEREVVAVIGDGALINGLAFEALNNVHSCGSKVTIVLNDNKMSISPRVGGLSAHLAQLAVSSPYRNFKHFVKERCRSMARGGDYERFLSTIKTKLKGLLLPANVFEAMEISYWGPFDGHDVQMLRRVFDMSKIYPDPLLIHVITQKGKGCPDAEAHPSMFHGVGSGTVIGGPKPAEPPKDWSAAAARSISRLAESDARIVACTAAMEDGTRLSDFKSKWPRRFFDVGIAEGHMLTFAAGLAVGGMRPVVCIYSTFLQRAVDQLEHDICMQGLPVLICADRAGLNGEDGETHQGLLDIAWGRAIPDLAVASPRDEADLKFFMDEWLARSTPMLIRYPKGRAPESLAREHGAPPAPWGRAEILRRGERVCIVCMGATVQIALDAADTIGGATVADLRFASPLDIETIDALLASHEILISAEDGYAAGGFSEAIASRAGEIASRCRVVRAAVAPRYIAHATRAPQMAECGLTPEAIARAAEETH